MIIPSLCNKDGNIMSLINSPAKTLQDIEKGKILALNFIHRFDSEYKTTHRPKAYIELVQALYQAPKTRNFIDRNLPQILKLIYRDCDKQELQRYVDLAILYAEQGDISRKVQLFAADALLYPFAVQYLESKRNSAEFNEILLELINTSRKCENLILLEQLHKHFPQAFELAEQPDDSEREKLSNQLNQVFAVNDELKLSAYSQLLQEFALGFGKITLKGGLLVCLERQQRKNKTFNPTLIEEDQLEAYVSMLSQANSPLNEIFIITGSHWYAGQIVTNKENETKILILNSLDENSNFTIGEISDTFRTFYPEGKIFSSSIKRQHAPSGCSVFALEDAWQLNQISQYLDKQYADIFEYLEEPNQYTMKDGIYFCQLPLVLMRGKQSKKLISDVLTSYSEPEKNMVINKKKETAEQSVGKHFDEGINQRISHRLFKMAVNCKHYLLQQKPRSEELEKAEQPMTLKGCQQRLR